MIENDTSGMPYLERPRWRQAITKFTGALLVMVGVPLALMSFALNHRGPSEGRSVSSDHR